MQMRRADTLKSSKQTAALQRKLKMISHPEKKSYRVSVTGAESDIHPPTPANHGHPNKEAGVFFLR